MSRQKSYTAEMMTGCGKIFITITEKGFLSANTSKEFNETSPCGNSNWSGWCEIYNTFVRQGGDLTELVDDMKGHACSKRLLGKSAKSCSDAFAKVIDQFREENKESK